MRPEKEGKCSFPKFFRILRKAVKKLLEQIPSTYRTALLGRKNLTYVKKRKKNFEIEFFL